MSAIDPLSGSSLMRDYLARRGWTAVRDLGSPAASLFEALYDVCHHWEGASTAERAAFKRAIQGVEFDQHNAAVTEYRATREAIERKHA